MFAFTKALASPKTHHKHLPRRHLLWGVYVRTWGVKKGGECLLKGDLLLGAYGKWNTWESHFLTEVHCSFVIHPHTWRSIIDFVVRGCVTFPASNVVCCMYPVWQLCFSTEGDLLQLGRCTVFRFNNPQEAENLRRRQSVSSGFPFLIEFI